MKLERSTPNRVRPQDFEKKTSGQPLPDKSVFQLAEPLSKAVQTYCSHTANFFDGTDFDVAKQIYRAFIENQEHSFFFAVGTNDGRDVADFVAQPWYDKTKATVYGMEASGMVAKEAQEKCVANPEVTILHNAVSDKDGLFMQTVGTFGTEGVDVATIATKESDIVSIPLVNGESRFAETIKLSTFAKTKRVGEFAYVLIDVEGHETPTIRGMDLEQNAATFPIIQWELGQTWIDDRLDGNMTQTDMTAYLEGLGYTMFLMGVDLETEEPLLMRVSEGFMKDTGCTTNGGPKSFIEGNALAIQDKLLTAQEKPWLSAAVAEMVARGNKLIETANSGCSTICPSFHVMIFAALLLQVCQRSVA
jgi:FkbM family methyltransferase